METAHQGTPASHSRLSPRKLLVRGVNWLGDAVMTTPALLRLREHFPVARISLLSPEKLSQLWQHHPAIDEALSFQPGEGLWSIAQRLRTGAYDAALILPNSPRSALEVWLSGIGRRLGYARPWRSWCLTDAFPARPGHLEMRKRSSREVRRLIDANRGRVQPDQARRIENGDSPHQIHEYLHLASCLGANPAPLPPRLEVLPDEVRAVEADLLARLANRIETRRMTAAPMWLGLNPSAAYGPAKCWPPDNFAAVARELSNRFPNSVWLVFGNSGERELCEAIVRSVARSVNLAGETSLRGLMALLKLCRVLLTNDSGPMHVAAALGAPVIVPFGSTSPELTAPGLPGDSRHHLLRADAPCSPCFRRTCPIDFRCMTGITMATVSAAVLQTLQGQGISPPLARS